MTHSTLPITIPLSKKKLSLAAIGSLAFVVIGILFVNDPGRYQTPIISNPTTIFISGMACILFFSICFIFIAKKIGDSAPGLIIAEEGITDNSGGVSAGQILWSDIEHISVMEIHRQRLIMLWVKNPQDYINRQTSWFKRRMMAMNYKMYGTPLSISANGLKINFEELMNILTNHSNTNASQPSDSPLS